MKPKDDKTPVLIKFPAPDLARLDAFCARVKGVRVQHILEAVSQYLDRQEETFRRLEEMHGRKK